MPAMSNITAADLSQGYSVRTAPLYQYDYGQILQFSGIDLPQAYEVHFSNELHGEAVTQIGDAGGVTIPDTLLTTGLPVYAWLFLHTGEDDGETEYAVTIPVIRRAAITDDPPTPVEQSAITQAIAALDRAVEQTAADVEAAGEAQTAAEAAQTAAETAQGAAETAQGKAEDSQAGAEAAERGAQIAERGAQSAQGAAETAQAGAQTAQTAAETAQTGAEAAQGAAETAQGKAEDAQAAAEAALAEFTGVTAEAQTLPAGSSATASYDAGVLTLGIPRGDTGATGPTGPQGPKGDPGEVTEAELTAALAPIQSDVGDLKSAVNDAVIYPENTTFTNRIQSTAQLVDFAVAIPNIKKFDGLVYYNGKLISSSGSDSYCFIAPYDNFVFAPYMRSSDHAYTIDRIPNGVVNEAINAVEISGTVLGNSYYTQYTIQKRGTVVLFAHGKTFATRMYTTSANHYTQNGLELNGIQDHFLRYSVLGDDTEYIPVDVVKLENKLVNTTTGGVSTNTSYDTYYIKSPVSSMSITCTNGFRAVITALAPDEISENGHLQQVVYSSASERVETFAVPLGMYAVIAVAKTAGAINLKSDLVKSFTLPALRLNYGQKNGFYAFEKSGTASYLYIYYVSGNKIVRWQLHNVPATGSNSNTWQIGHVMGYDFDGMNVSSGVELVSGGEFELAFKEYGAADYCGGNNHGDENTTDFTLMIDGKVADLTNMPTGYRAFDRIDAIEHAYINRCDAPSENILKHQKIWTFENGTVKVRQTLEFLEAMECDFLCCMLAANRSAFTHGVRQGRVGTEDMSTSTFDRISTRDNEMMYLMYGTNAAAKVTARLPEHTPAGSLWINNAAALNKLYYNYFGQMPRTPVTSGTVLKWEQEYDIAYN